MAARILGVLNGQDLPLATLEKWANSATNLYAADGAARRLLSLGFCPTIVGDGDSGPAEGWPSGLDVRLIADQETSDTDKLLAVMAEEGHETCVLAGIEGDNPMHVLANLHSVARASLQVVLRYRRFDGWLVTPERPWHRTVPEGNKLALIPLTPCQGVELTGVRWPLRNATLAMGTRISLSNLSSGDPSVSLAEGVAVLLVRRPAGQEPPWS